MDTSTKLTSVLSLCTGYGGIERGLELAGVRTKVLAHVEIEAFAIANLVNKMEQGALDPAPIWTNLKTLNAEIFRDSIDVVAGGYPCQPFSSAGKREGGEDPRHLFPHIQKIIRLVKPRRVFFENVEGHISLGLREVLNSLERGGYKTAWGIFSAEEVGAPHRRKRVYIMGDSKHSEDIQRESAHTKSKRVQGLRTSGEQKPSAYGQEKLPVCESERSRVPDWEAEPDVGRVVDGCAHRVDRIRLLGNGVVPQTAALAWTTLNKELSK